MGSSESFTPGASGASSPGSGGSAARAKERKSFLGDVVDRVGQRTGKIPTTGRFHHLPDKLEHHYEIANEVLGKGCGGVVRMAFRKENSASSKSSSNGSSPSSGQRRKFAVKAFRLDGVAEIERAALESEVEIFLTMDHPHIARLVDVFKSRLNLHLVMECLEGGELFDRVAREKVFSESDAAETTNQMLLAINYLHTQGIVHRDLKLENFLYDKQGSNHLKLIDFGFSKIWDADVKMHLGCGTLSYVAPEVLKGEYDNKCDMWSLGVIVFILLAGYMPFSGQKDACTKAILEGRYNMKEKRWKKVTGTGRNFMESLLKVDPAQRPTAIQAMEHPWIAELSSSNGVPTNESGVIVDDSIVHSLREFGKASKFRRACMSMMAWSLSSEERSKVSRYFLEIDKSKEGTITLDELKQVFVGKLNVLDAEVMQIFDTLDTNKDDRIHYSDFLAAMVSTRISMHDDLIRNAFDRFDADSSGYITVDNLRQILGDTFEGAEVEQLLSEADFLRDGRISYSEFVAYLKGERCSAQHVLMASRFIDDQVDQRKSALRKPSPKACSRGRSDSLRKGLPSGRCFAWCCR